MLRYFIYCCSLLLPCFLAAQFELPGPNHIFDNSDVGRVDIIIDKDDLTYILEEENQDSNEEFPATFVYTLNTDSDTIEQVGFRLRGNTSRASEKNSFKVSFNTFKSGQKYKGLEKLNLNGEHNDPTISRAKIGWQIMADMGVAAARTNHVTLFINGEYRGLYLNVEHIDEEFIQKRFDDPSGNLYKCLWPADLTYKGSNPDVYKEDNWGRRTYDLKTNTELDDYTDIAHLIDIINNTAIQDLSCELEKIFDIQNYLKFIAADIFMGNWDGNIYNRNNFYLYNDPCSGRFTMIPYDLDNIIGIDWFGVDWSEAHIDYWKNNLSGGRPLFKRLMQIPTYKRQVEEHLEQFKITWTTNNYRQDFYDLRDILLPFRQNDVFAEADYGYTMSDFSNNFTHGLGDHATQGLIEYFDKKIISISEEQNLLTGLAVEVLTHNTELFENSTQLVFTTLFAEPTTELTFHYSFDENTWLESALTPDTQNQYSVSLDHNNSTSEVFSWYTTIDNGLGSISRYPECDTWATLLMPRPTPNLVINEILASNSIGQQDEADEYEDWIELYNPSDAVIYLGNLYLTDDSEALNKWRFPDLFINPNSYITVFADDDQSQGDLHCNFKLNKDGEYLAIVDSKENYYSIIDSLTYVGLQKDVSFGRLPNGIGEFENLPYQTFGRNNEDVASAIDLNLNQISIYPNPTIGHITIESMQNGHCSFVDVHGRTLSSFAVNQGLTSFDLSHFGQGVYLASAIYSNGEVFVEKIVVR